MLDEIKDFLLNQAAGRILVRVAASACAYLASGAIGLHVSMDPNELNAFLQAGLHSLISKLKPR